MEKLYTLTTVGPGRPSPASTSSSPTTPVQDKSETSKTGKKNSKSKNRGTGKEDIKKAGGGGDDGAGLPGVGAVGNLFGRLSVQDLVCQNMLPEFARCYLPQLSFKLAKISILFVFSFPRLLV